MKDLNQKMNLNLQVKSIARLLDELGYPDPNDADGDWGPIGPVVRGLTWASLNPQPLPPKWIIELLKQFGPSPDPLKGKEGPHPDPWKGALLARVEIDRMVGLARMLEATGGERGQEGISRQLAGIIDEWCETPPRPRWPLPWPFPFRFREEDFSIGPVDLVMMGVQFQKAAEALPNSTLAEDFSAAANRLTQTGLERLEANQLKAPNSEAAHA